MTNTDVDTCASRTVHVQIGNGQILPSQKQQHKHALVRANRKTHMYSTWSTVQTHQWFLCNYVEEPGGPRFHSRHKICYVHDFRITHITAERSKQVLLKTLLSIHTDISPPCSLEDLYLQYSSLCSRLQHFAWLIWSLGKVKQKLLLFSRFQTTVQLFSD